VGGVRRVEMGAGLEAEEGKGGREGGREGWMDGWMDGGREVGTLKRVEMMSRQ
jgi:hypothetical protein